MQSPHEHDLPRACVRYNRPSTCSRRCTACTLVRALRQPSRTGSGREGPTNEYCGILVQHASEGALIATSEHGPHCLSQIS